MNLRDLEYAVAVAEYRHYGKAAEACNISQPTLSMQLKKLEETLGVTLFERSHKQVIITSVGEAILERAQRILRESKDIRDLAKTAHDPLSGDVRLGIFPTLAPYLLPLCIANIHKELPKINLLLIEEKTDTLLTQLKSGTLDAALLALPIDETTLETAPLFDDPFYLAVPAGHALSTKKFIDLEDLRHESLLLLDEGHCLRTQALKVCSVIGASEQQQFRATSLETLRHMVAAGVGITLIPRIAIRNGDGITYIPFKDQGVKRTVGLVWRKKTARERVLMSIKGIIANKIS